MEEKKFVKGCEAVAEAAIRAGCRFFAGYPITPQNEVPEYLSRRLPEVGGIFMQALKKGFQNQLDKKGFSFIEFISNCPTNWGMSPLKSLQHIDEIVTKLYCSRSHLFRRIRNGRAP